ncbi:EVE domain-containing protein [Shewanella aestuarii]|uniref:EVE domain-containing protein n=1 Tax=Shewanella aestuarii TaxID=1028752 RepID=A0A6G9QJ43_9GAMM|nr:EVE domain-containing protein [Shewanella aestuarii]QIR14408.1 EVE domain-containing protein [Shewanella aestuarii]
MKYWLMKSEPDEFSIDDLLNAEKQTTAWQGIRNYQARNFLRDDVQLNDLVLFYHSSCKVPAIVGVAKITQAASIDITAFDIQSKYYDAKSDPNNPRWFQVDLSYVEKFAKQLTLTELKADPALAEMVLVTKGTRLSVQPVTEQEFMHIKRLAQAS